jgi:hypothetical protein
MLAQLAWRKSECLAKAPQQGGLIAKAVSGGELDERAVVQRVAHRAVHSAQPAHPIIGKKAAIPLEQVGKTGCGTAGVGVGGEVSVVHSGDITVTGAGSQAIVAENINGGGGSASFDYQKLKLPKLATPDLGVSLPPLDEIGGIPNLVAGEPVNRAVQPVIIAARVGAADASMNASKVTITTTGTIGAAGDYGAGALVRSVGGGGGALTIDGSLAPQGDLAPDEVSAQIIYAVGLGAKNTTDSRGADLATSQNGAVTTTGKATNGVMLQSVGGGGGSAVVKVETPDALLIDGVRLGLGGVGTSTSDGGTISRDQTGAVMTTNDLAQGGLQSIGGAAARCSARCRARRPLSKANSGDGGAITLAQTGDVVAFGNRTCGIIAQSLSGGGGLVATSFAGTAGGAGMGSAMALTVAGSVRATGADASAILAQSLGSPGGGDIAVSTSGNVLGGSGNGAGIRFDGGANNTVRSSGTLSSVSNLAVGAGIGNDTVINTGLAVGNFHLGGGNNALVNAQGATLITIDAIDLREGAGSSGTFTNSGQLNLGLAADRYPIDLAAGMQQPVRMVADVRVTCCLARRSSAR